MNVVLPAITSRNPSVIAASVRASTDEVASSRIRIRGSARRPAIATRWRWPPDSVSPAPDDRVVAVGQLADEQSPRAARRSRFPRGSPRGARRRCSRRPSPRTGSFRRRRTRSSSAATPRPPRARPRRRSARLHGCRRTNAPAARPGSSCRSRSARRARRCGPARPSDRRPPARPRPRCTPARPLDLDLPGPSGSGGASGALVIRGSRSSTSNRRLPDAIARCAIPSAIPSIRIGNVSIIR